jgi:hypothetical protein
MKICGIYKVVSPSKKIYIGQSVDCEARRKSYSRLHCTKQKKLLASFIKYGFDKHSFEVIHQCLPEELPSFEKYYVDLFNTFNSKFGLNIRDGGGNRGKLSDEQKKKISDSLKGTKHSPERIEKNRIAQTGRKMSDEQKLKLSINSPKPNLGKKASDETRRKQSLAQKGKRPWMVGKTHSLETREKLRAASTGENNSNYGKPRTEETRIKISNSVRLTHERRKQNNRDSDVSNRGEGISLKLE